MATRSAPLFNASDPERRIEREGEPVEIRDQRFQRDSISREDVMMTGGEFYREVVVEQLDGAGLEGAGRSGTA